MKCEILKKYIIDTFNLAVGEEKSISSCDNCSDCRKLQTIVKSKKTYQFFKLLTFSHQKYSHEQKLLDAILFLL